MQNQGISNIIGAAAEAQRQALDAAVRGLLLEALTGPWGRVPGAGRLALCVQDAPGYRPDHGPRMWLERLP